MFRVVRPASATISKIYSLTMNLFRHKLIHVAVSLLIATITVSAVTNEANCRSQPGDASFPTSQDFSTFNSSVGGRLIQVVPSAQFCKDLPGGCTDAAWANSVFTGEVPGVMRWVSSFHNYRRWIQFTQ